MKSFIQYLKEAARAPFSKKSPMYMSIGHSGDGDTWKGRKHLDVYSKAHGERIAIINGSKPESLFHDTWSVAKKHHEDRKLHVRGRIDHRKKIYSVMPHVPMEKEIHPSAIQRAVKDVHKHMEKNHPDYTGHEYPPHETGPEGLGPY